MNMEVRLNSEPRLEIHCGKEKANSSILPWQQTGEVLVMQKLPGLKAFVLVVAAILGMTFGVRADCNSPKTITELQNCWQQSWNSKQLDAVVQLYADNGTLVTADGRFQGRVNIKTYLKQKMDSGNIQFAFETLAHVEPNAVGYDGGTFQENGTLTSGGPQQQGGSYLLVARRDDKGKLVIEQHAFVAKKPGPPAAPCTACFL